MMQHPNGLTLPDGVRMYSATCLCAFCAGHRCRKRRRRLYSWLAFAVLLVLAVLAGCAYADPDQTTDEQAAEIADAAGAVTGTAAGVALGPIVGPPVAAAVTALLGWFLARTRAKRRLTAVLDSIDAGRAAAPAGSMPGVVNWATVAERQDLAGVRPMVAAIRKRIRA